MMQVETRAWLTVKIKSKIKKKQIVLSACH